MRKLSPCRCPVTFTLDIILYPNSSRKLSMLAIIGMISWRLNKLSNLVTASGNLERKGTSSGSPDTLMQPYSLLLTGLFVRFTLWGEMAKYVYLVNLLCFVSFFSLTTKLHTSFCVRGVGLIADN